MTLVVLMRSSKHWGECIRGLFEPACQLLVST